MGDSTLVTPRDDHYDIDIDDDDMRMLLGDDEDVDSDPELPVAEEEPQQQEEVGGTESPSLRRHVALQAGPGPQQSKYHNIMLNVFKKDMRYKGPPTQSMLDAAAKANKP